MTGRFECPPDHAHAESNTCRARHGCRCDDCVRLGTEYAYWRRGQKKAGKPLLVPMLGSARRVQALHRIGWSRRVVAERLGMSANALHLALRHPSISASTAKRIAEVYAELSMRAPAPVTPTEAANIGFVKTNAERAGWAPPLAWDDADFDNPRARPKGVVK